ncbi:MAG: hypothetical protein ABTS16_08055 [Candidatus Accumulibacter phosphatis]|jgi:hypothetical protein|uniref:Uncharacterized protein n=2 Tax=Candidatus Accumulibacter TaxID=327159 RepID=A0A080LYR6_9PROT|nr:MULTISPECIES: hypothetical protein [Candidatus Accumulibacter]KFB73926.1 MAG: hypothetical protein AW09_000800 [Candidatus Accumulibacter phosphatis]MBL8408156.1 hypothetical protein [Accumulibacter sp.]NMQ05995.1 hypothetical protein [Candidatus Accumulibacter contiguus]HCZ14298.1 hypothetical protein [Accumulibacter sp.]
MRILGIIFLAAFVAAFAGIAAKVPLITAGSFARVAVSAAIIAALPTLICWGIAQVIKFYRNCRLTRRA